MIYERFAELELLLAERLISKRPHPKLPLHIYNYTASAQHSPMDGWSAALCDCRGLVLGSEGVIHARPFRKFWNYEQVLDRIPSHEPFTVWEKLDGSLGVVFSFEGQRVVATRGAFDSDQARWAAEFFERAYPEFVPEEDRTYLFEIVYPANKIVVDYGDRAGVFLLAVLRRDGSDDDDRFGAVEFPKARRFDGVRDFAVVNSDPAFAGQEGFVVRWASGFRAKVKAEEYKRLHRLITQCSTRSIWEMLRTGADTAELMDRVPPDFQQWVREQIAGLRWDFAEVLAKAEADFREIGPRESRKEFALEARLRKNNHLLFSMMDKKPLDDAIWKIIEPEWAVPFRRDIDG
jgi:RNA ligase